MPKIFHNIDLTWGSAPGEGGTAPREGGTAPQEGGTALITGETARYLLEVLRLGPGDTVTVMDGRGGSYRAEIVDAQRREARLRLLERLPDMAEAETKITLIQGILKGGRMDIVVQKATELGVDAIVPAVTQRGQVRSTRKTPRWAKIALEAARQCGRPTPPAICKPVPFDEAVLAAGGGLIFWEDGGATLKEASKRLDVRPGTIALAIGSEGGFTAGEVSLAREHGFTAVSLGERILRAETAAIAAVALTQYIIGEI